jgi:hypothetical protein
VVVDVVLDRGRLARFRPAWYITVPNSFNRRPPMTIAFVCSSCLKGYEVPDEKAGLWCVCPACKSAVTVATPHGPRPVPRDAISAVPLAASRVPVAATADRRKLKRLRDRVGQPDISPTQLRLIAMGVAAVVLGLLACGIVLLLTTS